IPTLAICSVGKAIRQIHNVLNLRPAASLVLRINHFVCCFTDGHDLVGVASHSEETSTRIKETGIPCPDWRAKSHRRGLHLHATKRGKAYRAIFNRERSPQNSFSDHRRVCGHYRPSVYRRESRIHSAGSREESLPSPRRANHRPIHKSHNTTRG